jgi:hypothetical protein
MEVRFLPPEHVFAVVGAARDNDCPYLDTRRGRAEQEEALS